jgi:hypothetical protein
MSVLDFMEDKPKRLNRKRQIAEQVDVEMHKFTCTSCSKEYFDMNLYFHDTPTTKCLWCTKFPKKPIKKK